MQARRSEAGDGRQQGDEEHEAATHARNDGTN